MVLSHSGNRLLVVCTVPQGSVLGPLLFIIFVNDMDQSVLSQLLKFADDAKLFRCVTDQGGVNILKDDLKSLSVVRRLADAV